MGQHGFWALLEEHVPSAEEKLAWSCTLADLQIYLRTHEFDHPDNIVEVALRNAAEWNPGFPWSVSFDGSRYHFTPT